MAHIHFILHVDFENPDKILDWAINNNHTISYTKVYTKDPYPAPDSLDVLVVMGGSMGVYDSDIYLWIKNELAFIKTTIDAGKKVLGICLGSQLIASAMGANVYKNKQKEIGFLNINFTPESQGIDFLKHFPATCSVFQWHGDTFDIPEGCTRVASSKACVNQAFVYNSRVVALQFHLEISSRAIDNMIENCGDELVCDQYVQDASTIRQGLKSLNEKHALLFTFLDSFIGK